METLIKKDVNTKGAIDPLIVQPNEVENPLSKYSYSETLSPEQDDKLKYLSVDPSTSYGSGIPYSFNISIKNSTPNQLDDPNVDLVRRFYFNDKPVVDVGFLGGMEHSWAVQAVLQGTADNHLVGGEQYIPDEKQIDDIYAKTGGNFDVSKAVLVGATSWEDVEYRLELAKEQQEYRAAEAAEGLSFNMVLSAVGGGVSDPLSYVPIFGWGGAATRLAGRVITGAAMGATSNQLEHYVSGTEADIMSDMAVGAGFGLAIEGALKGIGVPTGFLGNTYRRSVAIRNAELKGEPIDAKFFEGYGGSHNLAGKINDLRVKAEQKLPAVSISGLFNKAQSKGLVDFLGSVAGYEGSRMRQVQPDGSVVYLKYAKGKKQTAEEVFNQRKDTYWKLQNDNSADESVLIKKGYSREEISKETISYIETGEVSNPKILNEPEFIASAERYKNFYDTSLQELKARKLISDDVQFGGAFGYVPMRLSANKLADFIESLPGKNYIEKLAVGVAKVKRALLASIKDERYRKALENYHAKALETGKTKETDFMKWLDSQADKDALGYLDQSNSKAKGLWDNDPSVPVSQYHDRTPWKHNATDESGFSMNDLRSSVQESTASYSRRLTGDIVAKDVHGAKGFEDLSSKLDRLATEESLINTSGRDAKKVKEEAQRVLRAYARSIYQMAKNDQVYNETALSAIADSIKNLSFFTKNAFMAVLNYTEISEGIKAYGGAFVLRSLPVVNRMVSNWTKGNMSNKEAQGVLDLLFGSEIQQLSLFRDIKDSALTRFHGDHFKAMIVGGTTWLANSSPLTKFLQSSQAHIVGAAQGLFLADMVRFAHGLPLKQKKFGFISDKVMARLNIDEEDLKNLTMKLHSAFTIGKDSKISISNIDKLVNDPNAMRVLRRLGDYVGDEVIQRKSLSGTFIWNGANTSPIMDLALQFKSFALDSYNKRLVKMMNRVEEGEYFSQFLSLSISSSLAIVANTGIMGLKLQGMTEEQREMFYLKEFGTKDISSLDPTDLYVQLAVKGFGRTNVLAAPMLLANSFGIGTGSKTTGDLSFTNDEDWDGKLRLGRPSADYLLRSMLPAYSTLTGVFAGGAKGIEYGYSKITDDVYTPFEQEKLKNSFYNSWRSFTPNMPYLQNTLINLMKDETPTYKGIE